MGRRLSSIGHDITVLTVDSETADRVVSQEGVNFQYLDSPMGPHLALPAHLRHNQDIDVVIDDLAHVVPWFSPQLRATDYRIFSTPPRSDYPGPVPGLFSAAFIGLERSYRFVYASSDFVTESRVSVEDLEGLGVDPARITRIPPGIDSATFNLGSKTPAPQLIFFAGLRPYKRPLHSLLVLNELLRYRSDVRLVVSGRGPQERVLRVKTREMGLEESVSFAGLGQQDRTSTFGCPIVGESAFFGRRRVGLLDL